MRLLEGIEKLKGVNPRLLRRLHHLGIKTIRDLLFHFPFRYDDFSNVRKIRELKIGELATIYGRLADIKAVRAWKRRMNLAEAVVEDETGRIRVVWFNQGYLADTLHAGETLALSGKLAKSPKGAYLANPAYERLGRKKELMHTAGLAAVYPETSGLTSRWLRLLLKEALAAIAEVEDPLPDAMRRKLNLLPIGKALLHIHFPKTKAEAEAARRRFSFEDILLIQLRALRERKSLETRRAPAIRIHLEAIKKFVSSLTFALTNAQRKAAWEIVTDTAKPRPMNRLLEGDVGSGKTVVAALAALNAVTQGFQVTYLAPTAILALQHFSTFKNLLGSSGIAIGLLTGSQKRLFSSMGESQKADVAKLAERGEVKIVIGTHAVLQDKVRFQNLGLVIVDEQHRFGVNQRAALIARTKADTTRTDADNKLLYEDLTYKIRGIAFKVKKELGLGHKEVIYQKAIEKELKNADLFFEKEKVLDVYYGDEKIGVYRPDFAVGGKIILEIKALPSLGKFEKQQIWHYLKTTKYHLALLINFGRNDVEIERIIHGYIGGPYKSASDQNKSLLVPHFLSMTATPIPRTLALTVYGDLDISILDQMPRGRKPVLTKIVPHEKRDAAYGFMRKELGAGRQVFVICPRIEIAGHEEKMHTAQEIAAEEVKAVKLEHEKLKIKVFPEFRVAMLHGKMKPAEKEKAMRDFQDHLSDILVSTSVVEVGVDVPNATIMLIEGAEKFGLAQIHQFRGRVGRAEHQSYCFLATSSPLIGETARLKAVVEAKNGFELAEKDLQIRGPGDFFGARQSGIPPFAYKSFSDARLVQQAREAAAEIIAEDPGLKLHPELKKRFEEFEAAIHFE